MTNKEAIEFLKNMIDTQSVGAVLPNGEKALWQYHIEALNMAISALQLLERLPSAESGDWMEQNKDRILKAGMEGREVEFRIGGRLFAIREKAQ